MQALYYQYKYGGSAPDEYNLLTVDPADINHMLCRKRSRWVWYGTKIKSGDWDCTLATEQLYYDNEFETVFDEDVILELSDYVFYTSIRNHLQNEIQWEKTEFHQWIQNNADKIPYYTNHETIKDQFQKIDTIAEKMRKGGYQTQRELLTEEDSDAQADPCPEYHEIVVNIGRDGRLLFEEGRHRFCVAKSLGIDTIPVRIFVRHREWQRIRHEIFTATSISSLNEYTKSYLNHPDIKQMLHETDHPILSEL